jgi:hypothetical protein
MPKRIPPDRQERKKPRYAAPGSYTFPKPRHQWFKPHMSAEFFSYANRLTRMTPLQLDKLQVRVYQDWPVRLPKRANVDGSKPTSELELFDGTPVPGNPCLFGISKDSNYEKDFLERYGSGKFRIMINELGVDNAICSHSLELIDMVDYPPKIAPEEVDLLVPANQNYIRQMRDAGVVFPGEGLQEEEEEEEVNAELVSRGLDQAETVGKLAATVENLKEKMSTPVTPVSTVDPQVLQSSVAFVQDMAKGQVEAAKETARQQVEAVKETFGKGFDIDHAVDAVVKLGSLGKKDDSTGAVLTILDRRNELLEKELAAMRQDILSRTQDELKFLRDRVAQQPAVAARAQADSQRSTRDEIRDVLEELGVGKPTKEDPWYIRHADKLLTIGGAVLGGIVDRVGHYTNQIAYYNAIGRAGAPPNPAGMGTVPGRPVAFQNPNAPPPVVQVVQPPSPPPQPPAAPLDPNVSAAVQGGVPMEFIEYLQRITKPFLKIWFGRPETSGADLAQWVIEDGTGFPDDEGKIIYLQLRMAGKDKLIGLLRPWAPIWNQLGQASPEELNQFIDEFMSADQEDDEPDNGKGPQEVVRTPA